MIPLTGFIDCTSNPDGKVSVEGFAFQVPGFEFLHTWATPSIAPYTLGMWHVSHWESGLTIGSQHGVVADTSQKAARAVVKFLLSKGTQCVRERLHEKGFAV